MNSFYERILGCLSMSAIGDALGVKTENLAYEQIAERCGGSAQSFVSVLSEKWGTNPLSVSGNTRDIIRLIRDFVLQTHEHNSSADSYADSCGVEPLGSIVHFKTASRAWGRSAAVSDALPGVNILAHALCAGLFNPGQPDNAVSAVFSKCTERSAASSTFAGAGAVASGISQALVDFDIMGVYRACLYGARQGEQYGAVHGRIVPGASVEARLRLAMHIVANNDPDDVDESIVALLGCLDSMNEAVPAAVGHFLGAQGDPLSSVTGAVFSGGASRIIASISGQLSGALRGINRCPRELCSRVDSANALQLSVWSDKTLQTLKSRYPDFSVGSDAR